MTFWSSQTLERKLDEIVKITTKEFVDCNAVTLKVGPEIYITPSLEQPAPNSHTKQLLKEKEPFAIPPGQFAFILTEEAVEVPSTAMAFISIKATFKLKGLVNVSGFHVDPGWKGPLIFAVFNIGPAPVHLERGLPLFLIWFADLDQQSEKVYSKPAPPAIPPQMINNITGELGSLYQLDKRMRDEHKRLEEEHAKLREQIHEVEKSQEKVGTELVVLRTLAVGLIIAVIVSFFRPTATPIVVPPVVSPPLSGANLGPPAILPPPTSLVLPSTDLIVPPVNSTLPPPNQQEVPR